MFKSISLKHKKVCLDLLPINRLRLYNVCLAVSVKVLFFKPIPFKTVDSFPENIFSFFLNNLLEQLLQKQMYIVKACHKHGFV